MSGSPIEVTSESATALAQYARIPIAFDVREVFDLRAEVHGGPTLRLPPRRLGTFYTKDYDALDGGPTRWPERFDVSVWGFLVARMDGRRVGGATVAINSTGELDMAEARNDLAVLWDLRVALDARRQGVGAALFRAAEAWATTNGCRQLKVETQNINVPACRFYERQGCVLRDARAGAYVDLPDEVQLLWYKTLSRS